MVDTLEKLDSEGVHVDEASPELERAANKADSRRGMLLALPALGFLTLFLPPR